MLEKLPLTAIEAMLDALPVDLTFMDADDKIRYFNRCRIFKRPPECLGRDVRECHQPSSHSAIDRMVVDFRSGARDVEEHIVEKADGRRLKVRYMAARDCDGQYQGLVEMVEEIN
ncbi:MAG: PAS domain-containing protein [Dehalogenimonas sp.]